MMRRRSIPAAAGAPVVIAVIAAASWIHAATHGFYVDQACRNPGWDKDEEIASSAAFDPMLYSGIALAGANRRAQAAGAGEDGILTADEFSRMDLSHVRGMVITGCDTGLGDYVTGEGVYGLRRALERAGVRSLTLALWPVDDQAAARWALAFYDGLWRRGLSTSTANRLAMRRVRQELVAAARRSPPDVGRVRRLGSRALTWHRTCETGGIDAGYRGCPPQGGSDS
jgi:CHAT domain-containing protein